VLPEATGVSLGMVASELTRARPTTVGEAKLDSETHFAFREATRAGGSLLYLVSKATMKLERIQAQDMLRVEDIEPRIQAQISRFGAPAGAWDCPALPSSLPTRRYLWLSREMAWVDNYLVVGDRVAATLYVAEHATIQSSLRDARCTPTPADRAALFPALPSDPRAVKLSGSSASE
jgi:hypothetical protein